MFLQSRVFTVCISILLLLITLVAKADVVKPALIEIVATPQGLLIIEARVSVEALLTGINGQYKNTKEAPTANEYDVFREMSGPHLKKAFVSFQQEFLALIKIENNQGKRLPLRLMSLKIPEPGYTKVPRISVITLVADVPNKSTAITWYYPATFGDNAVRLKQEDVSNDYYHWSEWQWIRDDMPSKPFSLTGLSPKKSFLGLVGEYVTLGFSHILPKGLDHILFILGLFFLALSFKSLVWQVTMFTVAHSLTLGLGVIGWVSLPANIIEPLIALSIVYIGIENTVAKQLKESRLFVVFVFGLLHGLGFASVLDEFGMSDTYFMTTLLSFNLGVELGQITIIVIASTIVYCLFKNKSWYRASIARPASLFIALVGLYWFFQRLDLNFMGQA